MQKNKLAYASLILSAYFMIAAQSAYFGESAGGLSFNLTLGNGKILNYTLINTGNSNLSYSIDYPNFMPIPNETLPYLEIYPKNGIMPPHSAQRINIFTYMPPDNRPGLSWDGIVQATALQIPDSNPSLVGDVGKEVRILSSAPQPVTLSGAGNFLDFNLAPGSDATFSYPIHNSGPSGIVLSISAPILAPISNYQTPSITVTPSLATMPPGSSITVLVRVSMPQKASQGLEWGGDLNATAILPGGTFILGNMTKSVIVTSIPSRVPFPPIAMLLVLAAFAIAAACLVYHLKLSKARPHRYR